MKKTAVSTLLLSFVLLLAGGHVYAQTLAFPGAEGFGRFAKGARGAAVKWRIRYPACL